MSTRSNSLALVLLLAVVTALAGDAHAQQGRANDFGGRPYDGQYDDGRSPGRGLASNLCCLALIAIVGALVAASNRSGGSTPRQSDGSGSVGGITPDYVEVSASDVRKMMRQLEEDDDADEDGDAEFIDPAAPLGRDFRTVQQIVAEIISNTEPLGVSITEEQLAQEFGIVGPSDVDAPIKAKVTSTPLDLADFDGFEPLFDGHVGTLLFGVNLIEERKVALLACAFDAYGNGGGLDRAYVSRFTMRVSELLTVSKPEPLAMPQRGKTVTLGLEVAAQRDESGEPVINVATFSVPREG